MQHGIRCKNCNISFNKNESLRQHQENSGKCKKKKDKRRENKSVTKKKKFIFVWPLNKKDVPVKEECDCGKIHYDIDKCRYFGEYRCYKCKNRWKSGWTWYGEYQKCIKCGKKNAPIDIQPLRTECQICEQPASLCTCLSRGPHQVDKCSMCKKLGEDCS